MLLVLCDDRWLKTVISFQIIRDLKIVFPVNVVYVLHQSTKIDNSAIQCVKKQKWTGCVSKAWQIQGSYTLNAPCSNPVQCFSMGMDHLLGQVFWFMAQLCLSLTQHSSNMNSPKKASLKTSKFNHCCQINKYIESNNQQVLIFIGWTSFLGFDPSLSAIFLQWLTRSQTLNTRANYQRRNPEDTGSNVENALHEGTRSHWSQRDSPMLCHWYQSPLCHHVTQLSQHRSRRVTTGWLQAGAMKQTHISAQKSNKSWKQMK